MVVYVDVLLVINLVVDYLVLFGTARLSGAKFIRAKGLLASILGALYSLVIFADISGWFFVLTKFAVSSVMLMIVFGKRKIMEFVRLMIIFYICAFLFSGFMMLINSVINAESFFLKGGIVYFELSPVEIVLSGTAAFIVTEFLRRFFRRGEPEGICTAKIFYNGSYTVLNGFVDTGNNLTEPLTGIPVAISSPGAIRKILPETMFFCLKEKNLNPEYRFFLVPCKTISGTVLIPAFRPEKVLILNENGEFFAEEIMIGISEFAPENTLLIGKNLILKEVKKTFAEV